MKIIKTSSLKQRKQEYKDLQSPTVLAFVEKYESLIPWDQAKVVKKQNGDVEAWLQSYISENLLTDLHSKIDPHNPDNTAYVKNLTEEYMDAYYQRYVSRGVPDPMAESAYEMFKRYPDMALPHIQRAMNSPRISVYNGWKKNLSNYDPAFNYIALSSIIKNNPPSQEMSPYSAIPESISEIHEMIQNGLTQFNFMKVYEKSVEKNNINLIDVPTGENSGWIYVPSISNDPENFEKNKEILRNLSIPAQWCTGAGNEEAYLNERPSSMGNMYAGVGDNDFWVYVENGRSQAIIRTTGNKIEEIQGAFHHTPTEYWEEISNFIEQKGMDSSGNHHYENLKEKSEVETVDPEETVDVDIDFDDEEESNGWNTVSMKIAQSQPLLFPHKEWETIRNEPPEPETPAIDLYGNLEDDIDYLKEYGINVFQLLDMLKLNYNLIEVANGEKLIVVDDGEKKIISDYENQIYPSLKKSHEWIDRLSESELDEYYPMPESDFWDNPTTLYHNTPSENIEYIKKEGLEARNVSRGLDNKDMGNAVFTYTDIDELGNYGDGLVAINTHKMKEDGYMPEVSGETPLEEKRQREGLAHKLGIEDYEHYVTDDYADNTIAIYGDIDPKYLDIWSD